MQVFRLRKWLGLFCFSLVFGCFLVSASSVEAQNCSASGCHKTWTDNAANKSKDTATTDYLPVNLEEAGIAGPFYTIPQGHTNSAHAANLQCTSCHVSQSEAHNKKMVKSDKCQGCHNTLHPDTADFSLTRHANPNGNPTKFFDQTGKGSGQAFAATGRLQPVLALFQADKKTIVTKTQRLEECSVCHNYAMQYPKYKSNLGTDKLTPQVGCGACHDAHIVSPAEDVMVNSTVEVATVAGSGSQTIVSSVTKVNGRLEGYRELKPYKLAENEAQDAKKGIWSRGSAFTRPNRTIIAGTGTISDGTATSNLLTYTTGGLVGQVQPHDTVFIISATGETTLPLPPDSVVQGSVTVSATLDRAAFGVEEVTDQTLTLSPGVVATATVTYVTDVGPPIVTATLPVPVQFSGSLQFEVRNMNLNTEALCGSCHTKGNYKFSAYGKLGNSFIDQKSTHNNDILTQYKSAGHADILAPAWEEFSARPYGGSHTVTYPFDMSVAGAGTPAQGQLRNGGNTTFQLTSPDPANVYLTRVSNTTLPVLVNNYACNQCHHGLGAIDYMKDVQGTANAQVLWGDSTVTCVTCHDTHNQGAGANIRTPVYLSYNSRFTSAAPVGKINKFMDGTDIPAEVGTGAICLFCHQGRESGLTVYKAIKTANATLDPYDDAQRDTAISATGISFVNPHYLDSGAILWGRNAWEYFFTGTAQEYSEGIPAHQTLNCAGCHMGEASEDNSEGGHTWRPRLETCQTCHGPVTSIETIPAIGDYDGDGTTESAFEEFGTLDIANPANDTGLYGLVRAALADQGIFYNPDAYPYFFSDAGFTTQYRAWTTNQLSAAFNLSWAYKSGNCVPYHNAWYGAQILQDSLTALGAGVTAFRPDIFNRTATDYRLSPYIL